MSDQTQDTVRALLAEGFRPPFHVATIAKAGMMLERFDVVGTEIKVASLGDHMAVPYQKCNNCKGPVQAVLFDGEATVHQLWTDARGAACYVRDGKFAGSEWPTPNPN